MKNIKLNISAVRRIVIGVFCAFIGISVAIVMLNLYEPEQNTLRALSSVCMDVICMIILFILILSFAFDNYESNRTTKLFAGLLVATLWALYLDFLNWAFDGSLELGQMTFWYTVGSLCMGSILACIFSLYLYKYMEETHDLGKMRTSAIVCAIMNLISFVLTFVLALTGTAFKFVDGHYEIGALYDVVTVIPVLCMLYLTGYVIRYVKTIGLHDVFAAIGYIILMVAGALFEAEHGVGTTYVAVAIADVFIFVMLQNGIIAQEKRNVQELMKISNTDELTGFYNRHAYEDDITQIDTEELNDDFVYVSVDVNSLKKINDSLGHNVGDELLIGAADCLAKCFGPYGKLYRIGGDEFVAIINASEEQLDAIKTDIEKLTQNWEGKLVSDLTISCGYVTKKEASNMTIQQIAILADRRMYEAKADYYRRAGIERRKNP